MFPSNALSNQDNKISDIQALSTVNSRRTALKWLLIVFFMGLLLVCARFATDNFPVFFLIEVCLASWTQSAIIEELHDGYHYRLFASRRANEMLTRIYGSLVGISAATGRAAHHKHHHYFGTPQDPDYPTYSTCPVGLKSWIIYFVVHFSGYGAIHGLRHQKGISVVTKPDFQYLISTAFIQLILLMAAWFFAGPLAYFLFWLLPLLTLTFGISHFRTMLEHWSPEPWVNPNTNTKLVGALYNFEGIFQLNLMGAPFGYGLHGAHHIAPSIPNYNLEQASESEYICPPELVRRTTYCLRLKEIFFSRSSQ